MDLEAALVERAEQRQQVLAPALNVDPDRAVVLRPPTGADSVVGRMERFGLVGLPNAGKSSLFNALSGGGALAAAYPFATVDPNVGVAAIPDPRLDKLAAMSKSAKTIYAPSEFVDIGGLVEGASTGEGLGNRFLAHIREVDAVVLDKTGTVTTGRPVVTNVVSFDDAYSPEQVLGLAASSEIHSRHPLAQAVIRSTEERRIEIPPHEECEVLLGQAVPLGLVLAPALLGARALPVARDR